MPTQNSTADIVSSQWKIPELRPPRLLVAREMAGDAEFELLRACCHSDGGKLPQALRREVEWDSVFEQAAYHRLLPAIYAALKYRPDVPASIHPALRARYVRHCQRVMRFSAELAAILEHFEAKGIPVISQKGPALGHLLYGDSAMREFGDLDLLVRPADVSRAVGALSDLGYKKNLQLSRRQEKAYLKSGYEYVFGRDTEPNLIELQWNLLPRFYSVDFDIQALFTRSRECQLDGFHARMLGLEDQMLFLCVHAAKHQWAQLGLIRDIAVLARFELDWDWITAQARQLGILRIVIISLLLAREVLGFAADQPSQEVPETARKLVSSLAEAMRRGSEIPVESLAYFRFMLEVRERRSDRMRFLWRLAATPSVGEWKSVAIPDFLFPLFGAVRAARVARKIFQGVFQK